MIITPTIVLELYEQVIQKFTEYYKSIYSDIPNISQVFSLKGHHEGYETLHSHMQSIPEVREFISNKKVKINPRYLYDKKNQIDKQHKNGQEKEEVKMVEPYGRLFFLYLGYENLEDYLENHGQQQVKYTGYFYSYRKHEIQTFELKVNYQRKPVYPNVPHQEFTVSEIGFHDHKHNPIYSGYGYILEGKLQLMMWAKEGGDRLRILLDSGDDPESQDSMRGIILAVSSFQGKPLTALETVVVKHGVLQEKDIRRIKRFLYLHRYNFRIDSRPLNLNQMLVCGYPSDFLRTFVGAWRVFRCHKDRFVSSILLVEEDLNITCYSDYYDLDNLNEQVCLPSISREPQMQSRNTMLLDCFPKEGAKKISSLMLNIPDSESNITGGIISIVGGSNEYPSTAAIAMGRDEELFEKLLSSNERRKVAQEELTKTKDLPSLLKEKDKSVLPYKQIVLRLKEIEDATVYRLGEKFKMSS